MSIEQAVVQHYTHGSLERTLLEALAASGKDLDRLQAADLVPVDEFHIGGRQATIDFTEQFGVRRGMRLLDVGCGLGGAARFFAHEQGCQVTGIDLTDEYISAASALARRVGLAEQVSYRHGNALDLPFAPESFDGAYMFHVGMNIEHKATLFSQVRRVLIPSGIFGIYDVMRTGPGDLSYPVPWASRRETSFVGDPASYRALLEEAGFEVLKERSRRAFALEFLGQMQAKTATRDPAPLGLHILMGRNAPEKVANMLDDLTRGLIAPTQIFCRAV